MANLNAKGREREFFIYGLSKEIIRVNIPVDKIDAIRQEEMETGVEADTNTFIEYLIKKGYKATLITPKIDKVL